MEYKSQKSKKLKNEMTTSGENAASNCKNARFCTSFFYYGVVSKVGSGTAINRTGSTTLP
jgi:hypothetical protein